MPRYAMRGHSDCSLVILAAKTWVEESAHSLRISYSATVHTMAAPTSRPHELGSSPSCLTVRWCAPDNMSMQCSDLAHLVLGHHVQHGSLDPKSSKMDGMALQSKMSMCVCVCVYLAHLVLGHHAHDGSLLGRRGSADDHAATPGPTGCKKLLGRCAQDMTQCGSIYDQLSGMHRIAHLCTQTK